MQPAQRAKLLDECAKVEAMLGALRVKVGEKFAEIRQKRRKVRECCTDKNDDDDDDDDNNDDDDDGEDDDSFLVLFVQL